MPRHYQDITQRILHATHRWWYCRRNNRLWVFCFVLWKQGNRFAIHTFTRLPHGFVVQLPPDVVLFKPPGAPSSGRYLCCQRSFWNCPSMYTCSFSIPARVVLSQGRHSLTPRYKRFCTVLCLGQFRQLRPSVPFWFACIETLSPQWRQAITTRMS